MQQPQRKPRDRSRLAPSIQRAHRRVRHALIASGVHAALLLGTGLVVLSGDPPAWAPGIVALAGAIVVPLLGRAAYYGNSFAGLLLLLTVIVPLATPFIFGWSALVPIAGLLFAPFYHLGAKGAIGLRGRRRSKRS